MRYAHAVAEVRAAERELMARLPEGALMQRAAFGLATVAAGMLREAGSVYGSRVVLLVGVGDNGGDALYAGALLAGRGVAVHAVLVDPDRAHAGGLSALRDAGGRVSDESVLGDADLVVDGLLGIGGRGGLRGAFTEAAAAAQASGAPILAVDLPSGIDADTGEVAGAAVRADVTVTFGTHKPGLFVDPGAGHAGIVEFVDIGLEFPPSVRPVLENLQEEDVRELLPAASRSSHKYSRGVVGLTVGSERYPGAALLSVGAALRSGVGAVRYSGPVDVVTCYPEVIMGGGHVQAWVVGSGLGQEDEAVRRLLNVLSTDVPAVVDADGLRLLPRKAIERSAPTILTPHAGEAAALLDVPAEQIEGQRLESVRRLADSYDATVLLKGANTLIASPGTSPIRVNTHASPVLATAGSGDVLAGIIGGLLAGGLAPLDAASVGAYLHGAAGLLAGRSGPVAAGDLVASLPLAWQNIRG
jgi:ADP-dependent NAD(P)H-hydrate dehydratase / NAD(P)H-hydrate epimerase